MIKVNRFNISELMFEDMLTRMGKTVKDAKNNRNWKQEWVISSEEIENFKKYWIPQIKKTFKCNKSNAIKTLDFFLVIFGPKEL